jgi:hypothetical protein
MNRAKTLRRPRGALLLTCLSLSLAAPAWSGCRVQPLPLPGRERDPRELPVPADDRTTRAEDVQISLKNVTAKEPPTTLVAHDGTRCIVSQKRYDETRIGDNALCAWRTR